MRKKGASMADLNLKVTALPFEALLVAVLEFGARLIDLARVNRETMDPAVRLREDTVRVRGLERVDKILTRIEAFTDGDPQTK